MLAIVNSVTLGQCMVGHSRVYIECQRCHHFGEITFEQASAIGLATRVEEIEKRFRCRICEGKTAKLQTQRPQSIADNCPRCHQPRWKPERADFPARTKRCAECNKPLLRD